jgi:hypothetical protein
MAAIWTSNWTFPLWIEMAWFFWGFGIPTPDDTLYGRLAEALAAAGNPEDIVLSTLNYETLLEQATRKREMEADYFAFPSPDDRVSVFKLHGSCSFVLQGVDATGSIEVEGPIFFEGLAGGPPGSEIEVVTLEEFRQRYISAPPEQASRLPPVMCYYMNPKIVQVAAETMQGIQHTWQGLVEAAEKVAIVGVAPNPDGDKHLWNSLAATDAELLYVGGADAFHEWANERRDGRPWRILGARVDDSIDALIEEMLSAAA